MTPEADRAIVERVYKKLWNVKLDSGDTTKMLELAVKLTRLEEKKKTLTTKEQRYLIRSITDTLASFHSVEDGGGTRWGKEQDVIRKAGRKGLIPNRVWAYSYSDIPKKELTMLRSIYDKMKGE